MAWHIICDFGAVAGFGIGNGVQANSVADALSSNFGISPVITGIVLMILVGLVLVGGIKRISDVAGKLVPIMALFYIVAGLGVVIAHISDIPAAFALILKVPLALWLHKVVLLAQPYGPRFVLVWRVGYFLTKLV